MRLHKIVLAGIIQAGVFIAANENSPPQESHILEISNAVSSPFYRSVVLPMVARSTPAQDRPMEHF